MQDFRHLFKLADWLIKVALEELYVFLHQHRFEDLIAVQNLSIDLGLDRDHHGDEHGAIGQVFQNFGFRDQDFEDLGKHLVVEQVEPEAVLNVVSVLVVGLRCECRIKTDQVEFLDLVAPQLEQFLFDLRRHLRSILLEFDLVVTAYLTCVKHRHVEVNQLGKEFLHSFLRVIADLLSVDSVLVEGIYVEFVTHRDGLRLCLMVSRPWSLRSRGHALINTAGHTVTHHGHI